MKNGSDRSVLVAGGAGFLGRIFATSAADGASRLPRQFPHRTAAQSSPSRARAPLRPHRADDRRCAAGRSSAASASRSTAIFNLACPASPPHYQADPEHTMLTSVLGTRNLLRLAERTGARLPAGLDQRGLWRPRSPPAARRLLAARSTRPGRAPATTRASGRRRRLTFDFDRAGRRARCGSRASSTPTARGCGRMTDASSPTSSRQALAGERHHGLRRRQPDARPSATSTIWSTGLSALMDHDGRCRAGQSRQPERAQRRRPGRAWCWR